MFFGKLTRGFILLLKSGGWGRNWTNFVRSDANKLSELPLESSTFFSN
jgi:hypothetical protein